MSIAYDSKIVVSRYEHLNGRLICYSILGLRTRAPKLRRQHCNKNPKKHHHDFQTKGRGDI